MISKKAPLGAFLHLLFFVYGKLCAKCSDVCTKRFDKMSREKLLGVSMWELVVRSGGGLLDLRGLSDRALLNSMGKSA
ncbi:hypothetical protein DN062_07185 [Nitrincola tibetensis]|uniref:Uncharacterized protein n=1 Tax=Nitrincola tibetensis TaxID=2219697 RepID=A0A364NNF5_9GAMM|nr:hypothetical protein DN062_07185 [Nitrincola tibetensis]